jgi:cell surface protein SprA
MNEQYIGKKFIDDKDSVLLGGKPFDSKISGYNRTSADVLIPAFLAAYTGQDPRKISTNPFLDIFSLRPNWRISYDGFSRIPWVKENFKTVTFTHAYTCKYGIGGYTSFQNWSPINDEDNTALGFIRQNVTNIPLVSSPYSFASVSLTEQFSPLFGVNTVLKNSMTAKAEYRKQRNLALNPTSLQLIESSTEEWVVGAGYILKDFNVILKLKSNKQTQVKNDLKISADFSVKDIKTLIRKLDDDLTQPSMGSQVWSIKVMADYVFSSKMNIQLFADHQATTPLISSSFPVSTTNFGISFKFMLTR